MFLTSKNNPLRHTSYFGERKCRNILAVAKTWLNRKRNQKQKPRNPKDHYPCGAEASWAAALTAADASKKQQLAISARKIAQ
jgi:hypothetical protein